jgi:hypothetical protein
MVHEFNNFRKLFLESYVEAYPELKEAGHFEPGMLKGFEQYHEFYHISVAVDILFQSENGKVFEKAITTFCEVLVKQFIARYIGDTN